MKSFLELIQQRKSCRRFTDSKVSQEIQAQLTKALLLAPTSKNSRPWEFILVEDKTKLEALSFVKPHGSKFLKYAPLAIVVLADPEKSDVWIEDASIAAIYLQLAAEDLGLGSCWIQIRKRAHTSGIDSDEYIKRHLNIPEDLEVEAIIAIGYKQDESTSNEEKKLLSERIHKEHYPSSQIDD